MLISLYYGNVLYIINNLGQNPYCIINLQDVVAYSEGAEREPDGCGHNYIFYPAGHYYMFFGCFCSKSGL